VKVKKLLISFLNLLPYIRGLKKELEKYETGHYPGHFYSPIVSVSDVEKRKKEIFNRSINNILGIKLNRNEQKDFLIKLKKFYQELPFQANKSPGLRYYFENGFYSYSDAIFLFSLMRFYQPQNIVEVGSGFSSALMLDVKDKFSLKNLNLTFIDPHPDRLESLLAEGDRNKCSILQNQAQNIKLNFFEKLKRNDMLFIDSSHVSKTGSDVNYILFDVLPRLNNGVIIHFHDIFYPFEYPEEWVLNYDNSKYFRGFGWNEVYLLKSFLMFNDNFKILLFNTMLTASYKNWFMENMPLCLNNEGGSIWLQKVS